MGFLRERRDRDLDHKWCGGYGEMGTFLGSQQTGTGLRGWRPRLPRIDPLCSLKVARASKISADGNFRRSLVGSLRALTSAEMAALRCNAAARIGFRLAALHSVAERVNPRKARPPTPRCPRVLASAATSPFACRCWEKSARLQASARTRTPVLRSFPPSGTHRDGSTIGERSRGSWRRRRAVRSFGQTGTDRVGWYACPWRTLFATEWSAARKNPMRAAALHLSAAISADVKARRILTSGRRKFPSGNFRSARDLEVAKRVRRGQAQRANPHPSPFARRPYRTPPPPHQLRSVPVCYNEMRNVPISSGPGGSAPRAAPASPRAPRSRDRCGRCARSPCAPRPRAPPAPGWPRRAGRWPSPAPR